MTRSKRLLYASLVLFISFILFTILVSNNFFSSLDLRTTIFLQEVISRRFDFLFSSFSLLGSAEFVFVIILLMWAVYKKLNYYFVLLFFAAFHLFEFLGKFFVDHPGPPVNFIRYDIDFSFPSSSISTGSSFPSGHVGRTFFLTVILFYLISKTNLPKVQKQLFFRLLIILDFLMLISRVYLGEHWLSDVIGGGFLGASLGLFSILLI